MNESRKAALWDAALDYIIGQSQGGALDSILGDALGMTPDEIVREKESRSCREGSGYRETPDRRLARDVRECAHYILRRAGADTQTGDAFVWFSGIMEDGPGYDLAANPIFRQAVQETLEQHEGVYRCDMEEDGCRISLSPELCPRISGSHGRCLKDCMSLAWTDAILTLGDHGFPGPPLHLGPETLTEAGWMHWSDVLSANVTAIRSTGHSPLLILDNVNPERLRAFEKELWQCQRQQTPSRWFNAPGETSAWQSPELRV